MRHYLNYFAAALALSVTIASRANAEEQEKPWSVDTSVGVFSDYMFRGLNLYPGTSIQPSVTATYDTGVGEISGNLWMHISGEGNDGDSPEPFTELDETISYSYSTDLLAFSAGIAWYTYPDRDDDIHSTAEVFGSVGVNVPLNPVVSVFHDFQEFDTQYYELGFSHSFEDLIEGASVTPFVGFGFASKSEKVYDKDGFVQATVGVTLAVPVGAFELAPTVNYTFEDDDNAVNEFWAGTTLSYSL